MKAGLALALAVLAASGCASSGYWRNLPEARATVPAYGIAGDDMRIARVVHLTRRLAAVHPLPVEMILVASSEFLNARVKDARFRDDNAGAWRCGEGDPPPRGCLVVGSRMLGALSDDALAGVLAHELGHLEKGHRGDGKTLNRSKTTSDVAMAMCGVGVDPLTTLVGLIGCGVGLAGTGTAATIAAHARDREREADAAGMARLAAAGYCAGAVMQQTFTELAKLAPSGHHAGIFATHPGYEERWRQAGSTCAPKPPM